MIIMITAVLSGRGRQSPIVLGGEGQSLCTKVTLRIGLVDTNWSHVYINSVRNTYINTHCKRRDTSDGPLPKGRIGRPGQLFWKRNKCPSQKICQNPSLPRILFSKGFFWRIVFISIVKVAFRVEKIVPSGYGKKRVLLRLELICSNKTTTLPQGLVSRV